MDKGLVAILFVFFGIPAIIYGSHLLFRKRYAALRRATLDKPFPKDWEAILERNLPICLALPKTLRKPFRQNIKLFIAKTRFEGQGGLEIDDEIRVTIAAQACLLTLGQGSESYSGLKTVIVYPSRFTGPKKSALGVDLDSETVRLGESWSSGTVILAWDSALHGAIHFNDGQNVVIHEFAHQLDEETGSTDGTPLLGERSAYATWAQVMAEEYAIHVKKAVKGKRSVIDHYGASNPAEFFATSAEAFFEKPRQLRRKRPDIYRLLKKYFRLDPASWH